MLRSPRFLPSLGLIVLSALVPVIGLVGSAQAHNALASSDPVEGAQLDAAPTVWTLTFTGAVPLDSASAEVVLADGTRAGLAAPVHGASDKVIVFTFPAGLSGEITARWRLVGTDGHVISGRVGFTVPVAAVTVPTEPMGESTIPDTSATTMPETATPSITTPPTNEPEAMVIEPLGADPISESIRWIPQVLAYLALVIVGGLLFAEIALARGILRRSRVILALQGGALTLFAGAAVQSLIHVSDIEGITVTRSFGEIGSLFDTTAGSMLAVRTLIGFVLLMVTLTFDQRPFEIRLVRGLAAVVLLYIMTIPFTGHSRSMRWPTLGVPADIVHLVAVTVWVGGLIALVAFIMPAAHSGESVVAYLRFSRIASVAVALIVVTGVIQTIRLHSVSTSIFDSSHGRLLAIKVGLVAAMIAVGWWSRRLLSQEAEVPDDILRRRVLRVTGIEAGFGGVVIAVSAALVRSAFTPVT